MQCPGRRRRNLTCLDVGSLDPPRPPDEAGHDRRKPRARPAWKQMRALKRRLSEILYRGIRGLLETDG